MHIVGMPIDCLVLVILSAWGYMIFNSIMVVNECNKDMYQCLIEGKLLDSFFNSDLILGFVFIIMNIIVKFPLIIYFVLTGGLQAQHSSHSNRPQRRDMTSLLSLNPIKFGDLSSDLQSERSSEEVNGADERYLPNLAPANEKAALSCVICLANFQEQDNVIRLDCHNRHIFHHRCLNLALEQKRECPICRSEVSRVRRPITSASS